MTETLVLKKLTSLVSGSASRLRPLWGPLRSALAFNLSDDVVFPARCIAVSIDKGTVSVAYGARLLSRIRIKGIRIFPLENRYPTPEGLAASVSAAVNSLGALKTDVTLCVPRAWTILKIAEFPSTVKESISDVITYELDRLTPFSPDEALYDFRVVSEDAGKLTVLILAAKADQINPYINALRDQGHQVRRITTNLTGGTALCRYVGKVSDGLYIRITGTDYEGAAFSGGSVTGSIAGTLTAAEGRGPEADAVTADLNRLVARAGKGGASLQCFASINDGHSPVLDLLRSRSDITLRMVNDVLPRSLSPAKELSHDAIGGAVESLWPGAQGMNLLMRGSREKAKTPFFLTTVLLIALVVMALFYVAAPVSFEKKRLREIEYQIQSRKDSIKKVEALKKEVEALTAEVASITSFKEGRPMTLNIVRELATILPKTAWLSRVRVTETTVEIEGYASSATELLPKLEASNFFKKAEFASPTFRDARLNADRFSIKMEIEGIKKEEEPPKEEATKKEEQGKMEQTKKEKKTKIEGARGEKK